MIKFCLNIILIFTLIDVAQVEGNRIYEWRDYALSDPVQPEAQRNLDPIYESATLTLNYNNYIVVEEILNYDLRKVKEIWIDTCGNKENAQEINENINTFLADRF